MVGSGARYAHFDLDLERDHPARVDMGGHLEQDAGVDVLRRRRYRVVDRSAGAPADVRLLADRDLVARLDRRLLVVERRDPRIGDDLRVAVGVHQAQHRLDPAGEVRVVDDVGESLREAEGRIVGDPDGRPGFPGAEPFPRIAARAAPRGRAALEQPSIPKSISSFSVTSAIVTSIITCRDGMSSFFSAASITVYSAASRRPAGCCCPCRPRPGGCGRRRCPRPARARACGTGPGVAAGVVTWTSACGVSPAASGTSAAIRSFPPACPGPRRRGRRGRGRRAPGERLLQQRPELFGALVLQLIDVEARAFAAAALIEAGDPLLRLLEVRRLRRDDEQRVHPLDRDDAQDPGERAGVPSPITLSSSCPTIFTSEFCSANTPTDMPAIQSTSNMSIGSRRCGARARSRRGSSGRAIRRAEPLWPPGRTAPGPAHFPCADIVQRDDLHRKSRRQRAIRVPSCGVTLPRTATALGTILYRPASFTIVAPFIRSSVSSVAAARHAGCPRTCEW